MTTLFFVSFILFFALHCIPLRPQLKVRIVEKIGKKLYIALFASIAALTLTGMLYVIAKAEPAMMPFAAYPRAYFASRFLMPIAIFLILIRQLPGLFRTKFSNTAYLGIMIWSLIHILVSRSELSVFMFLGFLVLTTPLFIFRFFSPKAVISHKKPRLLFDVSAIFLAFVISFILASLHPLLLNVSNVYGFYA